MLPALCAHKKTIIPNAVRGARNLSSTPDFRLPTSNFPKIDTHSPAPLHSTHAHPSPSPRSLAPHFCSGGHLPHRRLLPLRVPEIRPADLHLEHSRRLDPHHRRRLAHLPSRPHSPTSARISAPTREPSSSSPFSSSSCARCTSSTSHRSASPVPKNQRMPPTACAHSSQRISTNVASGFSLAITAGFCEEFLYRGWLLNLTGAFLHSVRIGLLISSTFFGFAHIYQGRSAILSTGILGLVFGVICIASGTLLPSQFLHTFLDITNFLAFARLASRANSSAPPLSPSAAYPPVRVFCVSHLATPASFLPTHAPRDTNRVSHYNPP